jgi:hypothetical protein
MGKETSEMARLFCIEPLAWPRASERDDGVMHAGFSGVTDRVQPANSCLEPEQAHDPEAKANSLIRDYAARAIYAAA